MRFSIITASYNAANDLLRTAKSIESQSFDNVEWIVVDGASSDDTQKFFERIPRFAPTFTSEPDSGIYNALNKGISRASGDWLLFLGAGDELYADDTLERLSKTLQHVDSSKTLVYGEVHEVGIEENAVLKIRNERWQGLDGPWVIGRPVLPCHQGVLHRASLFLDGFRFNEKLKIAADNEILLRELIADRGQKTDQVIAKFLRGGVSSNRGNRARMIFECIVVNWNLGIFGKSRCTRQPYFSPQRSSPSLKIGSIKLTNGAIESFGTVAVVIMAAYNAERTIGDAIRSVLNQTCTSFELLICDDGSSDGTTQVVEAFEDSRIKLLRSVANRGPGPARDRAIACARGNWVTFLDADDQYVPKRLETLLRVAVAHPEDIVADGIMDCHDTPSGLIPWRVVWDDRHLGPADTTIRTLTFGQFLEESRQVIQPFLLRRLVRSLKATHGEKMNGEDVFFLLPFFAHGCVIRYVPQPLYLYRMTPGSLSTKNPDRFRIYREMFEEGRALFSHDHSATRAIDAKIESIRRIENYQAFLAPLRSGHLLRAWRAFIKEPWVAKEFAKRIFGRLPFHASRVIHRGKTRKVG